MVAFLVRCRERAERIEVTHGSRLSRDVQMNGVAVDGEPNRESLARQAENPAADAMLGENDRSYHPVSQPEAISAGAGRKPKLMIFVNDLKPVVHVNFSSHRVRHAVPGSHPPLRVSDVSAARPPPESAATRRDPRRPLQAADSRRDN